MATEQIFIWVCFQIKNIKWGQHIYIHIATFTFTYTCFESLEIQNPPGWFPVSPALSDLPLDWAISRGPFQPQRFCDSVHMHPAGSQILQRADTDQDSSKYNFFNAQ